MPDITNDNLAFMLENAEVFSAELSLIEFTKQAWHTIEPGCNFTTGWAVGAVAEHLQAITDGQIRRLLINIPPGCTKSMLTNVMWPAWEWGPRNKPYYKYISAGYEQGLGIRDLVRCRDVIKSEWYSKRWPIEFKTDMDQKTLYQNMNTGWRFASSVRGALTGHRADRIIIDDPHSVETAESDVKRKESLRWFAETLPTRLNKQDESAIVVIMQRLHQDDISGLILRELKDDWTILILPMEYEKERHCKTSICIGPDWKPFSDPRTKEGELLWPERFPRDSVEELKKTFRAEGGSYAEAAQLQQRPAPRGGGMFKRADFGLVDKPLPGYSVRGWDLAATKKDKSAFTAGCKMTLTDDGRLIIEHMERLKGSPNEVKEAIAGCAGMDGLNVLISIPQDPGQAGVAQRADLAKMLLGYNVRFSPESGSKETRAIGFAAQVEAGNVYLVRGSWNAAFLNEAIVFPAGKFKDQVDAATRAFAEILKNTGINLALLAPKLIVGYDDQNV